MYFRDLIAQLRKDFPTVALYVFDYESDSDYAETGKRLAERLASEQGAKKYRRIVLLGHSMGGLVSRVAAQTSPTIDDVPLAGILALASPNLGTELPETEWANFVFPAVSTPGGASLIRSLPREETLPLFLYGGEIDYRTASIWYLYAGWESLCRDFAECLNDGVVPSHSALASSGDFSQGFALRVARRGPYLGYDHSQMSGGKLPLADDTLYKTIRADINALLPPILPDGSPEFVASIGCACNPNTLLRIGDDLWDLVGVGGTSGAAGRLIKTSLSSGSASEPLGSMSPGLGGYPHELQSDGSFVYWMTWGGADGTNAILRLPVGGGVPETVVANVTVNQHYDLFDGNAYYKSKHADGTWWVDRVPVSGGAPSPVVQLSTNDAGFTVASGELFYEDCTAGTLRARSLVGTGDRQVTGDLAPNGCYDGLLIVGDSIYIEHVLPNNGWTLLSLPTAGGSPAARASLGGPADLRADGTYLLARDNTTGAITRYRLSDFLAKAIAARSCGGLALDTTYVYWTSSLAEAPFCLDGGSGPIVRLPKDL